MKHPLKYVAFSILLIMGIFNLSCETDIPETDITPPTFGFKITGDGFDHTFTQAEDFDNIVLYVKNNTTYNFVFSAGDDGGLRTMEWDIDPNSLFELLTPIDDPWVIVPNAFSEQTWIRWTDTTSANAQTGQLLVGEFRFPVTIENNESYTLFFLFNAADFGGQNGTSNSVQKRLKIIITDQQTAISTEVI